LRKLKKKKVERSLFCKNKFQHTEPVLKSLELLKVKEIYYISCLKTVYKALNFNTPQVIGEMFKQEEKDSRRWYELKLNKKLKTLDHKLPNVVITKVWNMYAKDQENRNLLYGTIELLSMKSFAKVLKEIELDKYYSICNLKPCYLCDKSEN